MPLYEDILDLSRQAGRGALSDWFERSLRDQVERGMFPSHDALKSIGAKLVSDLADYRTQAGVSTAVLGISGGVDSALTAALLKHAGWRVIGFTLPINQNPEETERGTEACAALGLEHLHIDLSDQAASMVAGLGRLDADLPQGDDDPHRIRRGNVRARLRMITLYDQAHRFGGLVASTDNFSELGAGFWTLHGDVGDLSPIQALLKSWEVPWMAREYRVPERIWRARPTDGLGIGEGDEAQIGAGYLEWDIMVFALLEALSKNPGLREAEVAGTLKVAGDPRAPIVLDVALRRLRTTWFKRINPIRLEHPTASRYQMLDALDARLFYPAVINSERAVSTFSGELQDLANQLASALNRAGMRLITAESCTSGLLGACIAAAPGSSSVLEGSFVSYHKTLKTDALGVSEALLRDRTAYDPEVARQMALGALDRAPGAGLALSVTGVGGPAAHEGKPAGLVYIAAASRGAAPVVEEHRFPGRPQEFIAASLRACLTLGLRQLGGAPAEPASTANPPA